MMEIKPAFALLRRGAISLGQESLFSAPLPWADKFPWAGINPPPAL